MSSPILSNIYLNKLDRYLQTQVIPQYTQGAVRKHNPVYQHFLRKSIAARKKGDQKEALTSLRQAQQHPVKDPSDPAYRRLRYIRYADDMLLGFAGPRHEAEQIKQDLGIYLHDELALELSQEKTLITHARTQAARFLGYDIQAQHCNEKRARDGRRRINAQLALRVPWDLVKKKMQLYQRGGKPLRRFSLASRPDYTILKTFQDEYRGFVQYYLLAVNVSWLHQYKWIIQQSLLHTLAAKYHSTTRAQARRLQAIVPTPSGPMKCLQVTQARTGEKPPLIARFGGIPLRRKTEAILVDCHSAVVRYKQKEVIRRLIAHRCELCQVKDDQCVVHQVRKLADLTQSGHVRPIWAQIMWERKRKTLIVCQSCHAKIHAG